MANSNANKFSIINGIVHKHGQATICPYQSSFISPGTVAGSLSIMSQQCKVSCPMCNVYVGAITLEDETNKVEKHFLQLTCGSQTVVEYIDEPKIEAPKPALSIAQ